MKWDWINLPGREIKILQSSSFTSKNNTERVIPINNTLFEVLKNHYPKIRSIALPDFVFCRTPGVKLNVDYVSKKFKKIIRSLGLSEKIHFHSLRHSFASNLVQRGANLYSVQKLLGHSDYRTTQIYSHLSAQNLYDTVGLLDNVECKKEVLK